MLEFKLECGREPKSTEQWAKNLKTAKKSKLTSKDFHFSKKIIFLVDGA